jgi:hypothetical protein
VPNGKVQCQKVCKALVRVYENEPVLSEQITEMLPSASTECSFLTIAFRLDIRNTPNARVTVVTIGKPSGIAATARDTVLEQLL